MRFEEAVGAACPPVSDVVVHTMGEAACADGGTVTQKLGLKNGPDEEITTE